MAKKTVFQDIDVDALDRLGVDDAAYYGIVEDSMFQKIATVVVTESYESFSSIENLLQTETTNSLTKIEKVFILPLCPVSLERIKSALKEHNISITNDYELADCILTHDAFNRDVSNGEKIATSATLMHLNNMYIVHDLNKAITTYWAKYERYTFWDERLHSQYSLHNSSYNSAPYDSYVLTGLSIKLADLISKGELEVITLDTALNSSSIIQTLDEQLVKDVISMVKGSSEERNMAAKILPTINHEKTPALFWELAKAIQSYMYSFNREKDVQYWLNKTDFQNIGSMSAEEAILHFEKEGTLDSHNFKMLEPTCRKEIDIYNRALYTFTVQVKPEYRKYLKSCKQ
jgi:hypothetical protein